MESLQVLVYSAIIALGVIIIAFGLVIFEKIRLFFQRSRDVVNKKTTSREFSNQQERKISWLHEKLFEHRTLLLYGSVFENNTKIIEEQILSLYAKNSEKEITIIINTKGGAAKEGLRIYNILSSLKCDVIGIVINECHSAGLLVYAGCKKRFCLNYSTFLFHSMTHGRGKIKSYMIEDEVKTLLNSFTDEYKTCFNILLKEFNVSGEILKRLEKEGDMNIYQKAETLKKLGIIDGVLNKIPDHSDLEAISSFVSKNYA